MGGLILFLLALQGPPRLAMTLPVAQQLAAAWQREEPRLACLYGHQEPYQGETITVADSVEMAPACGVPAIGMFSFVNSPGIDQDEVLTVMGQVLRVRTDLQFVGVVHGLSRMMNEGQWVTTPAVWWAIRPAGTQRAVGG